MFADDCLLYREIRSMNDSKILQACKPGSRTGCVCLSVRPSLSRRNAIINSVIIIQRLCIFGLYGAIQMLLLLLLLLLLKPSP